MAFAYYTAFTVDHTKVPNTDLTDFPVGIVLGAGFARLKTVGNGGHVQNASGFDIRPYSDAALTTALTFELVCYDATTGNLEMYVKIPTLSHTVDTVIYLGYGDASLSSDGSSSSTWNSHYKAVYHFGDGVTLSLADSTSNANTLTNFASATAVASGWGIGGAVAFASASSQYLGRASAPVTALPNTISALLYETDFATNQNGITINPTATNSIAFQLDTRTTGVVRVSSGSAQASTAGTFSTATWVHGAARMVTTTDRSAYLNGTGTQNTTSSSPPTPAQLTIGAFRTSIGPLGFWNGRMDEVRIANDDRGADWIATESNNLTSPSTFSSAGTEQAVGGGVTFSLPLFGALFRPRFSPPRRRLL